MGGEVMCLPFEVIYNLLEFVNFRNYFKLCHAPPPHPKQKKNEIEEFDGRGTHQVSLILSGVHQLDLSCATENPNCHLTKLFKLKQNNNQLLDTDMP